MIEDRLAGAVEAILFASGGAVSLDALAGSLGTDRRGARAIADGLAERYEVENRGIKIIVLGDAYQMCTSPDYFPYIELLGKAAKKRQLTQAVTETLAIVAYKQPVTKTEIENIRGVDADHTVKKLLEYGLVAELGRADAPGRPVLFGTTEEFLRAFGISSLAGLPELPETESAETGEEP